MTTKEAKKVIGLMPDTIDRKTVLTVLDMVDAGVPENREAQEKESKDGSEKLMRLYEGRVRNNGFGEGVCLSSEC